MYLITEIVYVTSYSLYVIVLMYRPWYQQRDAEEKLSSKQSAFGNPMIDGDGEANSVTDTVRLPTVKRGHAYASLSDLKQSKGSYSMHNLLAQ